MKLKIISDGLNDTQLIDVATGEELTQKLPIRRVTWVHEAGKMSVATLEIECVEVIIDGTKFQTGIFYQAPESDDAQEEQDKSVQGLAAKGRGRSHSGGTTSLRRE